MRKVLEGIMYHHCCGSALFWSGSYPKIWLLFTAVLVHIVVSYSSSSRLKGVIIFTIMDSILKFSRKEIQFIFTFGWNGYRYCSAPDPDRLKKCRSVDRIRIYNTECHDITGIVTVPYLQKRGSSNVSFSFCFVGIIISPLSVPVSYREGFFNHNCNFLFSKYLDFSLILMVWDPSFCCLFYWSRICFLFDCFNCFEHRFY
jgi:hypothetical protein